MTSVVTITPAFIIDRLNRIPPHSRERPGLVAMLRHIRKTELALDHMSVMLEQALELELKDAR